MSVCNFVSSSNMQTAPGSYGLFEAIVEHDANNSLTELMLMETFDSQVDSRSILVLSLNFTTYPYVSSEQITQRTKLKVVYLTQITYGGTK